MSPAASELEEPYRDLGRSLVTGATGFVGRTLVVELQARGVALVVGTRAAPALGVPWMKLLLPGPIDAGQLGEVETVFHLAGIAHAVAGGPPAVRYDEVNRLGTVQLARAAASAGVQRFVFVSSVKAVGEPGSDLVPEDSAAWPSDPYGMSKRKAEAELLAIAEETGMAVVIARPTLVYGPGVKGNLASLASSIAKGSLPPLPAIQNRRSLIGISDLVRALILLAEHPAAPGRVFVLSDGHVYSTDRLTRALVEAVGGRRTTPRFRIPLPVLATGARVGDVIERVSRWSPPLTTAKFVRLVGNAEYEAAAIRSLGFVATQSFEDVAGEIARSIGEAGAPISREEV